MASKIGEGDTHCKSGATLNTVYSPKFFGGLQYFRKNRFPNVPALFYRRGRSTNR